MNFAVLGFVKENDNFALHSYPCSFNCGEKSEILSTLGNMPTSGYYARDTQAMISQSPVHPSSKDLSLPADTKGKVIEIAAVPSGGNFETKDRTLYEQKHLMLPITATWIYSLGSTRLSTQRICCAI